MSTITQPVILPAPIQQHTIITSASEPVIKRQRNSQSRLFNTVCVNCKLVCGPDTSSFRRRLGHESEYMCSACFWYDSRHGGQPRPAILIERQKQKAAGRVTKVLRIANPKPKYSSSIKLSFFPILEAIEEQEVEVMKFPKHMAYGKYELVAALTLMKLSKVTA